MRREITDRRTLRTRQLLTDALGELIRTKRYEAITVQEIADRANVGRSTFYAHFADKDDLVADGVRRMVGSLETDDREVFLLKEVAGLSYAEIASACGLTPDAVRSRLHRTRLTLRKQLT